MKANNFSRQSSFTSRSDCGRTLSKTISHHNMAAKKKAKKVAKKATKKVAKKAVKKVAKKAAKRKK